MGFITPYRETVIHRALLAMCLVRDAMPWWSDILILYFNDLRSARCWCGRWWRSARNSMIEVSTVLLLRYIGGLQQQIRKYQMYVPRFTLRRDSTETTPCLNWVQIALPVPSALLEHDSCQLWWWWCCWWSQHVVSQRRCCSDQSHWQETFYSRNFDFDSFSQHSSSTSGCESLSMMWLQDHPPFRSPRPFQTLDHFGIVWNSRSVASGLERSRCEGLVASTIGFENEVCWRSTGWAMIRTEECCPKSDLMSSSCWYSTSKRFALLTVHVLFDLEGIVSYCPQPQRSNIWDQWKV